MSMFSFSHITFVCTHTCERNIIRRIIRKIIFLLQKVKLRLYLYNILYILYNHVNINNHVLYIFFLSPSIGLCSIFQHSYILLGPYFEWFFLSNLNSNLWLIKVIHISLYRDHILYIIIIFDMIIWAGYLLN